MVTLIAALANGNVIGHQGRIPFHSPEDMKDFKETTMGNILIMGRKTFESLGSKPLKGRINIVVSKDLVLDNKSPDESTYLCSVNSLMAAIGLAKSFLLEDQEIFVIGGADIYQQAMEYADRLRISYLDIDVEGDCYFPPIKDTDWEVFHTVSYLAGNYPGFIPFAVVTFKRIDTK